MSVHRFVSKLIQTFGWVIRTAHVGIFAAAAGQTVAETMPARPTTTAMEKNFILEIILGFQIGI